MLRGDVRPAAVFMRAVVIASLGWAWACGSPTAAPEPGELTAGHAAAPDTLFQEDWETGDLARWHDRGRAHVAEVITDPELARTGSRLLRVTIPPEGPGPWLTRFFMPGTDTDELYVRYHVRFTEDWIGGSKVFSVRGSRVDDRWSAFGIAGRCPVGTDFFRIGLITQATGDPGDSRFYVYYPGMKREPDGVTCWGRYRDPEIEVGYFPPLAMTRNRWHEVELWVKLNRPGFSDGELRFWIDGELRGRWSEIRLREANDLKLNSVQIDASLSERFEPVERAFLLDDILVLDRHPESTASESSLP